MKTLKRGDRCLVLWAKDWEPATYIAKACLPGCVRVRLDSSPFEVVVSEDEVRPLKESK